MLVLPDMQSFPLLLYLVATNLVAGNTILLGVH